MSVFKLISLIAFVLVVGYYLTLNAIYYQPNPFEGLSEEKIDLYQSISEEDRLSLIAIPQNQIHQVEGINDTIIEAIINLPKVEYNAFQEVIQHNFSLARWLHGGIRLILILFLFGYLYLTFTKKLNYSISFQKALYEGCKLSLGFCLFVISATMINQLVFDQLNELSIVLQSLLVQFLNTLKIGVMYSVFIAAFLYFHPQNQLRLKHKRDRLERKKK